MYSQWTPCPHAFLQERSLTPLNALFHAAPALDPQWPIVWTLLVSLSLSIYIHTHTHTHISECNPFCYLDVYLSWILIVFEIWMSFTVFFNLNISISVQYFFIYFYFILIYFSVEPCVCSWSLVFLSYWILYYTWARIYLH